ncbi:MAG: hypothetical protein ACYC0V_21110 [Armatimonadota bacterium]
MYNNVDIRDLQRAASFIMIKKRLKSTGIASIIFGAIAIYIGTITDSEMARLAISAIGVFLVAEGIWVISNPSPAGILMDCVGFAAVGLWNLAAMLTGSLNTLWVILGVMQLKWAFDRYKEYKIFSKLAAQKPTPESIAQMDAMVKDILSRNVEISSDLIEMRLKGIVWRILLIDRAAIFVAANGRGVFVQNREDVALTLQPGTEGARIVTVSGDVTSDLPAQMPGEHYSRYLAWKGVPDQLVSQGMPQAVESKPELPY